MKRRALIGSLFGLSLVAGVAVVTRRLSGRRAPAAGPLRVVSLSPALTETVLVLAGPSPLVGVSDFCELPPGTTLPRVGSALTPHYEAIAALEPSLILCDASIGSKGQALSQLAACEVLPWLTLQEVVRSTRRIGRLLGREAAGNELAAKLERRLSREPPPDAPRVLLLLSYDPARPRELWFIKQNSLHGAALRAAGARNAVDRDVPGLPKLSLEQLVALDPDVVLILPPPGSTPELEQRLVTAFSQLAPLRAVESGRVATVDGTQAVGPSILQLVDALELSLAAGGRRE